MSSALMMAPKVNPNTPERSPTPLLVVPLHRSTDHRPLPPHCRHTDLLEWEGIGSGRELQRGWGGSPPSLPLLPCESMQPNVAHTCRDGVLGIGAPHAPASPNPARNGFLLADLAWPGPGRWELKGGGELLEETHQF